MSEVASQQAVPAVKSWVVWMMLAETAALSEAVRLIVRDCESRGARPAILHLPSGGDEVMAHLEAGESLVVVSPQYPPSAIPQEQLIIAASGPVTAPARAIVPVGPAATPSEIALSLLTALENAGLAPAETEDVYSPEEEERLRKALDDLGYL